MSRADIKAAVRERDGYRCQGCGMTSEEHLRRYGRQLDVHRVVPGSAYTLDGCVTLCRPCHGSQPKRPPGQGDRPPRVPLLVTPEMREVLQQHADAERRSLAQASALLMEEILTLKGLWPPPAAGRKKGGQP